MQNNKYAIIIFVPALIILISLLCMNTGIFIHSKTNAKPPPNVIIIGIDTLRADHLGFAEYKNTAPNIEKLAAQSAVFTNAFSTSSWTLPSFHSILTSLYPSSHGVKYDTHRISNSTTTFAEIMKRNGYRTAGFICGPYLKSIFGFNQGFDLYDEHLSSIKQPDSHKDITSEKLTNSAIFWLKKHGNKKFFLFLHYWDPHYDYIPPKPFDRIFDPEYTGSIDGTNIQKSSKINPDMDKRDLDHILALYDGEIMWTDSHIGRLLDYLKVSGLFKNTIIVVTSDHGEEFLDHGDKSHRKTLYNEVIHVPLMFKIPGIDNPAKDKSLVSTVDIMPTVLNALNIKYGIDTDGISLIPIITKKHNQITRTIYSELYHKVMSINLVCIIKDGWKLIYDYYTKESKLYNIDIDMQEKNNLININTQQAQDLKDELFDWLNQKKTQQKNVPEVIFDDETMNHLKSLGYV